MKIFPSSNYKFHSTLSEQELMTIISNEIWKNAPFESKTDSRIRFEGYMNKSTFTLTKRKATSWHHSFEPIIYGRVINNEDKTQIEISIKPQSRLKIFISWILFLTILIICIFIYNYFVNDKIYYGVAGALVVLFIFYMFITFVFKLFSKELIAPLKNLFQIK